ncbi:transcription factor bHLH93-like [Diospyros lotus]|uniref:transcription factor bHLH93-like n=1 Tax=Diospyros lotus TaxID=55363 RepID=UPI00225558D8|nr:transcription factor bHLH93-like [Diospyros lotus]
MEDGENGLLEELLAPRRESWANYFPAGTHEFLSNAWIFESFDESHVFTAPNPSFLELNSPSEPSSFPCSLNGLYPFLDHGFPLPDFDSSSYNNNSTSGIIDPPIPVQEEQQYLSMVEDGDYGLMIGNDGDLHSLEERMTCCKVEMEPTTTNIPELLNNMPLNGDQKINGRAKKAERQPSKNLMAERRRRKRLNDRLSMLRSIVPKISKMDRTAILGDTIDYMKELMEKVKSLQEEDRNATLNQVSKDLKPNELLGRNSPKFDVERTSTDTRIDICCAARPGLLLSTVNTLEALGLDLQQCVVSCFNDFSMRATCSEGIEQQTTISPEDIKQALYRNAGYGGRYL